MNLEAKKSPWAVYPYGSRRLTRKIDETLKEINRLKNSQSWVEASRLQWELRNSWWGLKRCKKNL